MISMAVGYDDCTYQYTGYSHLLHVEGGKGRRVYHYPPTMDPEDIPTGTALGIKAMGLGQYFKLYITHPSTVTPKSGGVNVLLSSISSIIIEAF